ncbi:MAG: tetratricopeptide repeat protein, partial [Bacteroidota bacterium]
MSVSLAAQSTTADVILRQFEAIDKISKDSSLQYLRDQLELAKAEENLPLQADLIQRLVYVEANRFRFVSTFDRYHEMLSICAEVQDSICMGKAYSRIGHIHRLRNEYPVALEMSLKGIELLRRYQDTLPDLLVGSLNEVTQLYWSMQSLDKAAETAIEGVELALSVPIDSFSLSKMARTTGETFSKRDELERASYYLSIALDYSKRPNHLVHASLARVEAKKNNLRASLYHHERALAYMEEKIGGRRRPIPYINIIRNVGNAHQALKQYDEAIIFYEKAIQVAEEEKLTYETVGPIYKSLALTLNTIGRYEAAFQAYAKSDLILDSVRTAAAADKLLELEAQYEAKDRIKQIEYLNAQNAQRLQERNWLIGGIVAFSIFTVLILLLVRSRQKVIKDLAQQQAEIKELYEELKATQTQLVQSEKMASVGQLTAGIAHEINNPINFIATNVAALRLDFEDLKPLFEEAQQVEKNTTETVDTDKLKALIKTSDISFLTDEMNSLIGGIERGVKRTTAIITNLKTFTRRATDKFEPSDVEEGLNSTLFIFKNELARHDIEVSTNYSPLPLIPANMGLLNQVFANILSNAIQAVTELDRRNIHIATQRKADVVQIQITDSGQGMSPEVQERIFEPFFTTKEV